ncbi:MAG: preprotein translocase subunit SecG [Alphaproteobacteria bacterium]|nr:preprotein translocase subunit SecG [Alphaproteobacteria bacterium]
MTFLQFLSYGQVLLAILLVIFILLQQSDSSVGSAFGGQSMNESSERSRRGPEKVSFIVTIIIAVLFVVSVLGTLSTEVIQKKFNSNEVSNAITITDDKGNPVNATVTTVPSSASKK